MTVSPSPRRARVARMLPVGLGAALVLLAVREVLPATRSAIDLAAAPLACTLLLSSALVLCVLRARAMPHEARTWLAFAVAIGSWMTGELVRSFFFPDGDGAFPAVYDLFYLALFPLAGYGIATLVRGRVSSFARSVVLDGAIASTTVAAAVLALLVPVVAATPDPVSAEHNMVYLLGDAGLLGCLVAAMAFSGWRPAPDLRWLTVGLAVYLGADVAFVVVAAGGATSSLWVGFGWVIALSVVGMASVRQGERRTRVRYGVGMFVVPLAASLIALAVLVAGALADVTPAATALAAMALLLAMMRTGVTFRENARLALSRHQAVTDELTGLVNRRGLGERLTEAFATGGRPVGLLLIDLDRFKELNDTLGHDVGDRMLAELGPRLDACVPDGAVVARLGGDEFAVLLTRAPTREALADAAAAIQDTLEMPFLLDGLSLRTFASIGGALAPEDACDGKGLLRSADVAMYEAKRARRPYEEYRADRDSHSRDRLALSEELRQGVLGGELEVHYQPKADAATGAVVGVEALVRWRHPERGLLFPDAFITIAEESGVMRELTRRVLSDALTQVAAWRAAGHDLTVSVNLSMPDLLDPALALEVEALLELADVPAPRLILEITETVAMADPERVVGVLQDLRDLGVALSLDDFGTGYSSLAYLRRLPVEELKIDRSFVMDMVADPEDAVIVRATTDLGRALGLRVVAEGVESAEAWDTLRAFGCDVVQGYALSRPVTAAGLEPLLTRVAV